MGVRLRSADGPFLWSARRRYAPFVARGGDLVVDLATSPRPLRARADEPVLRGRGRYERHDFGLEMGRGRARAEVLRRPAALDGMLRVLLGAELVRRGGFLCHAAAVDGRLFPGRSGAGKSTLGRKAPRDRLLADELVGVLGGSLHSTPFWGDFRPGRQNGSRRLEGIFLLDRRAPRGVRPVSKPEALVRLLECALCFQDGREAAERVLRAARSCVEAAPAFVLSYDARRTTFRELESSLEEASG